MKLDDETRIILATRIKLTNEEIDKYERGYFSLSFANELNIRSDEYGKRNIMPDHKELMVNYRDR